MGLIDHTAQLSIVVAALFAYLVVTWRRGRAAVRNKLYADALTVRGFIDKLGPGLARVPRTAVFMTGNPEVVPVSLLQNMKHNEVLHEQVVLMTVHTGDVPHVPEERRVEVEALGGGFHKVAVSYGFMDRPNVPRAGAVPGARPAGRPGADLLLHRPRDADPDAAAADGPGRGARLRGPLCRQPVRDQLLPDPGGAGGRARRAGGGLSRAGRTLPR
jgi:hypothetical protein